MAETRVYNGHTYMRNAPGEPWRKAGPVSPQGIPANPIKVQEAQAGIGQTQASTGKTIVDTANTNRVIRQTPISEADASKIAGMRDLVGAMPETLQMFDNAAKTVDRFQTGPTKAARVSSALPQSYVSDAEKPGFVASLRANFMRNLLGIPQQDVRDYQELERLTNLGVAQRQMAQKGPQTESDALRYRFAGLSPEKDTSVNALTIGEGLFQGLMAQQKPGFYTQWANKYGALGAMNPQGKTVDDAWAEVVDIGRRKFNSDPRISNLREGGREKPAGVIRYDREGNRIR